MGRRGPQPQPTVLKLARGNPGKRAINQDEPELAPAGRAVPKGMTGHAREVWLRLVDELCDKGVLTVGDMDAFEEYCWIAGDVAAFRALIRKHGIAKAKAAGYVGDLNKLRTQLRQQAAHLGLTPTSRSGVKAVKSVPTQSPEQQRRERFFGQKKA